MANGAEDGDATMYKLMLIGDSGVGKTCFLSRYCGDPFNPEFVQTVGIDFRSKSIER